MAEMTYPVELQYVFLLIAALIDEGETERARGVAMTAYARIVAETRK